jgi:hypothetical protein
MQISKPVFHHFIGSQGWSHQTRPGDFKAMGKLISTAELQPHPGGAPLRRRRASWCTAAARNVASMATRPMTPPRGNTGLTYLPRRSVRRVRCSAVHGEESLAARREFARIHEFKSSSQNKKREKKCGGTGGAARRNIDEFAKFTRRGHLISGGRSVPHLDRARRRRFSWRGRRGPACAAGPART